MYVLWFGVSCDVLGAEQMFVVESFGVVGPPSGNLGVLGTSWANSSPSLADHGRGPSLSLLEKVCGRRHVGQRKSVPIEPAQS